MLTLFDFDGTLSNTREAIVAGLRVLVTDRMAEPPSDEVLMAHVQNGMSLHATIRSLHPAPESIENEIEDWATHYRLAYADFAVEHEHLYDGAVAAVECAARLGDVVIVSMKHSDELDRSIKRLGLSPLVDAFFGDDGVSPLKPDVALWRSAISPKFPSHRESRTAMIGDTGHDLEFARNCGLFSCWASYGFGRDDHCREIGFDAEVAAASEIPRVLEAIAAT